MGREGGRKQASFQHVRAWVNKWPQEAARKLILKMRRGSSGCEVLLEAAQDADLVHECQITAQVATSDAD